MTLRASLSAALAVALLTLGPPAFAEPNDPIAAESLFNEGRSLFEKGQFQEACERFSRSQQLDPAVGTLLNLGDCYERLGKVASAWGAYRQAVTLSVTRADTRGAADARRSAARIEPRLPRVEIVLSTSDPVAVARDGAEVPPATYNVPVPIDPGPHEITASAPERQPWSVKVEVQEGQTLRVRVPALEPRPAAPGDSGPVTPPKRTQKNIAMGLEIGGGAVLVAGLVFAGLASAKWSSITDVCPNAQCPTDEERDRLSSDVSSARTLATLGTMGILLGGGALAGGIVLHLTAPKAKVSVGPTGGARALGLGATLQL
jgi:hypothetical protein